MAKKGLIGEFKDFISRGNAMDMAVGVIIGGAFSGIVTSLTEDIISPILGLFGGMNFDQLSVNILGEVTLNYGKFITAIVNFLIMALIIFFIMKAVNTLEAQAVRLARLGKEQRLQRPPRRFALSANQRSPSTLPDAPTVPLSWSRRKRSFTRCPNPTGHCP